MAAAMVALATTTLGSAASSVTFGSIPATYRDLRLVLNLGNNSNSGSVMRFNGDSGSNYSYVYMAGNGSGTGSTSGTVTYINLASNIYSNNTITDTYFVDIFDYSATDKHKSTLSRGNNAATGAEADAARWANTAAITSITIVGLASSQMIAGSTLSLYGILS